MGQFVAGPLAVADAASYDAYNRSVAAAMRDLADEGKLGHVAALEDFLELSDRVRLEVRSAAARAQAAGQSEFELAVPMTRAEHVTLGAMGPALQTVLEIATIRGTVDTTPPEGAFRLMSALGRGSLQD
jgi:hypothetical protein